MRYILAVKRRTDVAFPAAATLRRRDLMKTLTTVIEWSAVAIAVYAALAFATSAQGLAAFA